MALTTQTLTVNTGRITETKRRLHVGRISSLMYGYLMLSSLQKNPRLNGGVMSPKNAFTRPTIRKHAKSTTIGNFPDNIGITSFWSNAEDSGIENKSCVAIAVMSRPNYYLRTHS